MTAASSELFSAACLQARSMSSSTGRRLSTSFSAARSFSARRSWAVRRRKFSQSACRRVRRARESAAFCLADSISHAASSSLPLSSSRSRQSRSATSLRSRSAACSPARIAASTFARSSSSEPEASWVSWASLVPTFSALAASRSPSLAVSPDSFLDLSVAPSSAWDAVASAAASSCSPSTSIGTFTSPSFGPSWGTAAWAALRVSLANHIVRHPYLLPLSSSTTS